MTSGRTKGSVYGRDKGKKKGVKHLRPSLTRREWNRHHSRLIYSSIPTYIQLCPKCKHRAKSTPHGMLHYKLGKFTELCQWGAIRKDPHEKQCPCVLFHLKKKRKMEGLYVARIICISGGRSFNKYRMIETAMENLKRTPLAIVSGCARGADTLGELYARRHHIPVVHFPADWPQYGKAAGAIRNKQMVDYADEFIVFWDGISPGTKHMIEAIKKSGKHLILMKYKGDISGETKEKSESNVGSSTVGACITGTDEAVLQPEPEHEDSGVDPVGNRVADPHMDDDQAP